MNEKIPFQYEVRFKLVAYDEDGNFTFPSYTRICKASNPLKARAEAFEIFNEYLQYPIQNGSLERDKRGNLFIQSPVSFEQRRDQAWDKARDKFKSPDEQTITDAQHDFFWSDPEGMRKFWQVISVVLKLLDEQLISEYTNYYTGGSYGFDDSSAFEIHKISSDAFEEQYMADHLQFTERQLYAELDIDISDLLVTHEHYGLQYSEHGGGDNSEKLTILPTPHIWCPLEEFLDEGYYGAKTMDSTSDSQLSYPEIIASGETHQVEFKSSLVYDFQKQTRDKKRQFIIAKTICGFLNSSGGILFVGVRDGKGVIGLSHDYSLFKDHDPKDRLLLELDGIIKSYLGVAVSPLIRSSIEQIDGKDVFVIIASPSPKPILLKNKLSGKSIKEFYVRMNASTNPITDIEEIVHYIFNKEWNTNSSENLGEE